MHPPFHSELVGLDWPILLIGHLIMFYSLTMRLDWNWIPLTPHEKLCGADGAMFRDRVKRLEKIFQNS